jgi:hypothetical protein
MENVKPTTTKVAFKWSIIYIITSIVITYAFQLLNVDQTSSVKYLGYIPFIAFLFMAQKEYRDQLGGYITFGEGFSSGFMYAVFSGIFLAIFVYLYLAILSPQILEQSLAAQQDKLKEQGNLSAEQIDNAMSIGRKYGAILGSVFGAIFLIIIGAILSLIGAAIFKKERSIIDIERESSADPVV